MCGIVGLVQSSLVNQSLYDSLSLLQHRGQDSTGMATMDGQSLHIHKGTGYVREAFRTRDMRALKGNIGVAHVRYATRGSASEASEAQPFYVNAPYGIVLVHNGNLINTRALTQQLLRVERRHLNTSSDTELLLNVLAQELQNASSERDLHPDQIFASIARLHERVQGSYAAIALIAGHGLLAFRDPYGIRPLTIGRRKGEHGETEWAVASESLLHESGGYEAVGAVAPRAAGVITTHRAMV
jgi:amidophosphoribosyltransferase